MSHVLSSHLRNSKKSYHCQAYDWIREGLDEKIIRSLEDLKTCAQIRQEGGQILPGMLYYDIRILQEGRIYTFRARKDSHEICLKYDLYQG